MRVGIRFALTLAVATVAGCRQPAGSHATADATSPAIAVQPQSHAGASGPSSACPAARFEDFARAFADDVSLQRSYTADPLRMQSIDATADPEPAPVVQDLHRAEIQFPIVPDGKAREARGLRMTFDAPGAVMKLAAPDSDDQTTYRFRKDACWTLIAVESDAL